MLALSWVVRGQPERARAIADALRTSAFWSTRGGRNTVAWLYLFIRGSNLQPIIEALENAPEAARPSSHAELHTLAALYAAAGRYREARDTIHQAAASRGHAVALDQLVIGRIAAGAGLTQAAHRAYQAVMSDPDASEGPDSSGALARLWLAELPR